MLNNPIMIGGVSGPSLNWKSSHVPFSSTWESVAYGNGTFVAVNRNGDDEAVYSLDGVTWNRSTLPAKYRLEGLAFGNGKFVAVDNGTNQAIYSTDGINWTATTLPASASWQDVAYGGGKFVAISSSDKAAYSTDGVAWTAATMPSDDNWNVVAYGDGKFVALIDDYRGDSHAAAYSTDGVTWVASTVPVGGRWYSLAYGDGKFVALDAEGTSAEGSRTGIYSADGINWATMLMPSTGEWSSLAFGDGKFVAICGTSGDGSAKAAYSYDGIRWVLGSMPETAIWSDVVYGGGKFVAISSFNWVTAYTVDGGGLPSLTNPGTAADLLSGKQLIDGNGNVVTGTMPTQGAQTITPGTSNKTIAAGRYLTGTQTIQGDINLLAVNIKSGVSIFGVNGSYQGNGIPADATLSSAWGFPGGMYSGFPTTTDIEGYYSSINSASSVYMFRFNYLGSENYNDAGSNKYVVNDIMILNSGTTVMAVILQSYYTGTSSQSITMYLNPSTTGARLTFSSRQLTAHVNLPALTGDSSFVFLPNESWQPVCYT